VTNVTGGFELRDATPLGNVQASIPAPTAFTAPTHQRRRTYASQNLVKCGLDLLASLQTDVFAKRLKDGVDFSDNLKDVPRPKLFVK